MVTYFKNKWYLYLTTYILSGLFDNVFKLHIGQIAIKFGVQIVTNFGYSKFHAIVTVRKSFCRYEIKIF